MRFDLYNIEINSKALASDQALKASALVGSKVLVNSNRICLNQEEEAKALLFVPAGVNQLIGSICAKSGTVIRRFSLNFCKNGFFEIRWDGLNEKGEKALAGEYLLNVKGIVLGKSKNLKNHDHSECR